MEGANPTLCLGSNTGELHWGCEPSSLGPTATGASQLQPWLHIGVGGGVRLHAAVHHGKTAINPFSFVQPEVIPSQPSLMRRLGAAGPVAIVLSFLPPLGGFVLLATLNWLGPWLRAHGGSGMVIYFLFTGILMGISFVPTYSCAILAGWAFGFAVGWPLAVVTITAASLLAYVIGRWIARDRVLQVIHEKPSWNAIYRALLARKAGQTLLVVTLLRVPPASPFALANFVLAATRVPLFEYTLGTLIGILPRTALATFAAAGLEQLVFSGVSGKWTVIAGIAATIVVCVVLGILSNRALRRITGPEPR